jgi:hypothetical protein
MALEPLGTMKPEVYATLAKDQKKLMRYNIDMPEIDYEHPYVHQEYPRYLYRSRRFTAPDGAARVRLQSALVANEIEEEKLLRTGWCLTPTDCDPPVETNPGAPEIAVTDMSETDFAPPTEAATAPVLALEQADREIEAARAPVAVAAEPELEPEPEPEADAPKAPKRKHKHRKARHVAPRPEAGD